MLSNLKTHFFWKFAFGDNAIFSGNMDSAYDIVQNAVKYSYLFFMMLVFLQLSNVEDYQNMEILDPVWPIVPFSGIPPVALALIFKSTMIVMLTVLFFLPRKRLFRGLFFIFFFLDISLGNSFGKVDHGTYLPLLLAFFLALLPGEKESNHEYKSILMYATAQFFLLMAYSLTGFWKVFWGGIELFTKDVSLFSPLTLRNTIIYKFELTGSTLVGSWFLEHYVIGYIVYLIVVYIELFAIVIFFKGNLHKIWGGLLMAIHIGIELILGVNFYQNVFVLGILLVYSPFHMQTNFKDTLLSLPVVSLVKGMISRK